MTNLAPLSWPGTHANHAFVPLSGAEEPVHLPRAVTRFASSSATLLAGLLAACSGNLGEGLPSVSDLPELPALQGQKIAGTPTEVYTRIARGAVTCWFGATGPLKGKYIYHADATPESKGGGATITVFGRDTTTSPDPRALKAFQIGIRPTGGIPELGVENFTIPEPLAGPMRADVLRWAAGEDGCGSGPVTGGWAAQDKPKPSSKTRSKTTNAAAPKPN